MSCISRTSYRMLLSLAAAVALPAATFAAEGGGAVPLRPMPAPVDSFPSSEPPPPSERIPSSEPGVAPLSADRPEPSAAPAETAPSSPGDILARRRSRSAEPVEAPPKFNANPNPKVVAAERDRAAIRDKQLDDTVADSHKLVAPILAMHPGSNVVICLAGCGDKPTAVQVIPRKLVAKLDTQSEMVPTSGPVSSEDEPAEAVPPSGDIICVAGCRQQPGEVVHKNVRLSWLSDDQAQQMRSALDEIAGRLVRMSDAPAPQGGRGWVSSAARGFLTGGTDTAAVRD